MANDRVLRFFAAFPQSLLSPDALAGTSQPEPAPWRRHRAGTAAKAGRTLLGALVVCGLALSPLRAQTASFAGDVTALGGGFSTPYGVAADAAGNVYVADNAGGAVTELTKASNYATSVTLDRKSVV